jgi:S-formylglutathione hydrolase
VVPSFDARFTPQQFLAQHLFPHLQKAWQLPDRRMAICGVGMGGQGALLQAYRHPRVVPVVGAIAPAIDFHQLVPQTDELLTEVFANREWARQHTAILHVHPLNYPPCQYFCCDPQDYLWFDSSDRLRMKLSSIGIPFEADLETTADGDRLVYARQMWPRMLESLLQGLERERLRVV